MRKNKNDIKITYHYVEPKTPQEREEAERRLQGAYKILFDATIESERWRQYVATRKGQKA